MFPLTFAMLSFVARWQLEEDLTGMRDMAAMYVRVESMVQVRGKGCLLLPKLSAACPTTGSSLEPLCACVSVVTQGALNFTPQLLNLNVLA